MKTRSAPNLADGKRVSFSNLDKPLYPDGFTKGQVINYYRRIAPIMLPHLRGRAITLKRYPNGSDEPFFFEKNCPAHRPAWMKTASMKGRHGATHHCLIEDEPSLLWAANLASLEIHVPLALANEPNRPRTMVFDLDPGPDRSVLDCARLALRLRDVLQRLGLESHAKSSGGKGIHVYVPLNTPDITFDDDTKPFARALALVFERQNPDEVVSNMTRSLRHGKILIDWSQNDQHKTTVCAYSLRARPIPTVSMPMSWMEIERNLKREDVDGFFMTADQVLKRVKRTGDLFDPVNEMKQALPRLG